MLDSLPRIDFTLRIKSRLNRKAGNPFNLQPRSFDRRPPNSVGRRRVFGPIVLKSAGKTGLIGAGFKPGYKGPFLAAHDVSAADFHRFLEDVFTAGKQSGAQQAFAAVAPLTMHAGITGFLVTRAILKGMGRRQEPVVEATVEAWQERFFGPRGLDVYVVQHGARATARRVGCEPGGFSPEIARLVSTSSTKKQKDAMEAPYLVIELLR